MTREELAKVITMEFAEDFESVKNYIDSVCDMYGYEDDEELRNNVIEDVYSSYEGVR